MRHSRTWAKDLIAGTGHSATALNYRPMTVPVAAGRGNVKETWESDKGLVSQPVCLGAGRPYVWTVPAQYLAHEVLLCPAMVMKLVSRDR